MFHIRIRYGVIVFNLKKKKTQTFFLNEMKGLVYNNKTTVRNKYMLQSGPCVLYFIDFGISD